MADNQKASSASATAQPVPATPDEKTQGILDAFQLKMQLLWTLTESQLKYAAENQLRETERLRGTVTEQVAKLRSRTISHYNIAHAANALQDVINELRTLNVLSSHAVLSEIIFASLFSSFDAFVGHLLRDLYHRCQRIYRSFEENDVKISDVLSRSIGEIIDSMIDKEIDELLHGSYSSLFEALKQRFNVDTLTEFDSWKTFIECSQRRHLITHCDGIVSQRYLDVCRGAGVTLAQGVNRGSKLTISREYLDTAIDVVTEVGLKLGQVLWRKSEPNSIAVIKRADEHLSTPIMFELLKRGRWNLVRRMGEFGQTLAKRSDHNRRSDFVAKVILINHAQGAKWSNDQAGAMKIVDAIEWSGSAAEFRLAVACLKDDWKMAAVLMTQVGKDSQIFTMGSYLNWPIFREFRKRAEFRDAFKATFRVEFPSELATEAESEATDPAISKSGKSPQKQPAERHKGLSRVNRSNPKVKRKRR